MTEVCSQAHCVWLWQLSLDKSSWFGSPEPVTGDGNLADASLLKPDAFAQGWIFLEELASFLAQPSAVDGTVAALPD